MKSSAFKAAVNAGWISAALELGLVTVLLTFRDMTPSSSTQSPLFVSSLNHFKHKYTDYGVKDVLTVQYRTLRSSC